MLSEERMHEIYKDILEKKDRLIGDLRKDNARLSARNAQDELAARYYRRMMQHIQENENLQSAWDEFLTYYLLAYPREELETIRN